MTSKISLQQAKDLRGINASNGVNIFTGAYSAGILFGYLSNVGGIAIAVTKQYASVKLLNLADGTTWVNSRLEVSVVDDGGPYIRIVSQGTTNLRFIYWSV